MPSRLSAGPIIIFWKLLIALVESGAQSRPQPFEGTQQQGEVIRLGKGLVKPSTGTPLEVLDLSGIDRLPVLRCNARTLHVFKYGPAGVAQLIRNALADALVPYYPLAGRLKFDEASKNSCIQGVDCCGQGVWFVEASSPNCTLKSLNYFDDYHNHASSYASLLPDHPPADDPLVLMQVTKYACGGFIMGLTFCHSICDGLGAAQFLQAVGEIARGASTSPRGPAEQLSVVPVWHRDFLQMKQHLEPAADRQELLRQPPIILPPHDDEKELQYANIDIPLEDINHLKQKFFESTGLTCSAFEIVAAVLWKNRTRAATTNGMVINNENTSSSLSPSSSGSGSSSDCKKQEAIMMKLVFFANCRGVVQPPLPQGFYGNCFFPVTITESTETLSEASLDDVVKLIQHAKTHLLPIEFHKWINGQLVGALDPFAPPGMGNEDCYNTFFISEWGRLGFNEVDYGWGPPLHVVPIQGSPAIPVAIVGSMPRPSKGIRLMTWCVHKPHLQPFLHDMMSSKVAN